MKLVYPEWSREVSFKENRFQLIVIENKPYFRRIVEELYEQIKTGRGRFVLSDGDRVIEISKKCELIITPFSLNIDDSRILKRIYKQLEEIALEEELQETREIIGAISGYLYRLSDYMECDLDIGDSIELQSIFKAAGVKPIYDRSDGISELIDYIYLLRSVLDLELVIIIGLRSFFSDEEVEAFYDTVSKRKIPVLLLENNLNGEIIKYEDVLTIDSDLCEI